MQISNRLLDYLVFKLKLTDKKIILDIVNTKFKITQKILSKKDIFKSSIGIALV